MEVMYSLAHFDRPVIPNLSDLVRQLACRAAVIVFGKRLKNGKLTREGRSRCDYLLHLIDKGVVPADAAIVFSGQHGEALLMQSYFMERLGCVTHWMKRVFLEPEARFTRENVEYSLHLLEERRVPFDLVYCISSNYHIEREQAIDILVPEVSDLRKLREKYPSKPVTLLGAPYPFSNFPDETVLWLGSVYRVASWWSPLEVTLRGLSPRAEGAVAEVAHIRAETVKLLELAIEHLDRLERRTPKAEAIADAQLEPAVTRLASRFRPHLVELEKLHGRLIDALGGRPEIPAGPTEWQEGLATLRAAKADLQHAADPDYHVS
jgi:hypothetical protein